MGQKIDARILNLPLKGDRSNTSVRSEGCCTVSKLLNSTTSSFKGGFFKNLVHKLARASALRLYESGILILLIGAGRTKALTGELDTESWM